MYVEDSRFDAAYRGNQDYLLELIEAQAEAEGLELQRFRISPAIVWLLRALALGAAAGIV